MKYIRLAFVLMCFVATESSAADIAFEPVAKIAEIGSTFTLSIIASAFPETEGGGAEFTFNPNMLQVNSVTVDGTVWDVFANPGTIDNVNGKVEGITVAAFNNPGADFTIATIEFQAVGVGLTSLVLSENPLNLWASGGHAIYPTLIDGAVNIINFSLGDGDVAPRGTPDGIINVADYLIAMQMVLGQTTPTQVEILHADMYPPNQGDGVIDISDLILLRARILDAQ